MQRKLLITCFLIGLCSALFAQHRNSVRDFTFLKGSWTMNTEKGRIVESWKVNKDSGMDGISFSISHAGDSTMLETVKIHESGGSIYYTPTGYGPGNDSTVSFRLISAIGKTFVFENLNHDFPQRIGYQFQSENKILAWIEGTVNNQFRKVEFPYTREGRN